MSDRVILLVEDSERDQELALRALRKNQVTHEVVVARDGEEALDYVFGTGAHAGRNAADLPTLVLLDIKLPKIDGLEVLRRIRVDDRTRQARVVLLTSSKEERDRLEGYTSGANSYVRKPIDFSEFVEAVGQLGLYWLTVNEPPSEWGPTAEAESGRTSKPLRALFVEDDERDVALFLRELRRAGWDPVFERVDTADALRAALARQRWDVVLCDWSLPKLDALGALAIVKELGLDVPFVVVSGTVTEDTAVAAMRAGAHDFLSKERLFRLVPALERELGEAALRRERRTLKAQLAVSERMASVGTLAAGMAHEINNPLAVVVANLELALLGLGQMADDTRGRPADDPGREGLAQRMGDVAELLRDAREGSIRIRDIVRELMIFSRTGDAERDGAVDARRVMESSLGLATNEIRHRARLVREYREVPPVHANESRLGMVFLNLIVNAAQAITPGHAEENEIRVRTGMDGDRVVVEVHDTGTGIAPEHLPRIFDAFFTTKPVGVGTGLGLAIVHSIVTSFHGEIEVQTELGSGTTFRVLLPVATAPEHESVAAPPDAAPADADAAPPVAALPVAALPVTAPPRRGRILVIDDEATICDVVRHMLAPEHYVHVATRASDALQRIRGGEPFDVILCDVMMPDLSGMDFHAELSRVVPEAEARVVYMTGGAFTAEAREFLDKVPNPPLEKPFDMATLRSVVRSLLR